MRSERMKKLLRLTELSERDATGTRVNRHRLEAGKQAVAEQTFLAVEDGSAMQSGRHVIEGPSCKVHGGLCLRDVQLREADGDFTRALLWLHFCRHPLQRGSAASVHAQPLWLAAVDARHHAQSTTPNFERSGFSFGWCVTRIKQSDFPRDKINLNDPVLEKIRPDQSIHGLRADGTQIPGLYAIGNCSAPVLPTYPGPGSTLGPAMTFAYQAAKHLTGYQEP